MGFTAPADDLAVRTGPAFNAYGDPIVGTTPAKGRIAQDIGDAIIVGLQSNATGLALRGELPSQQLDENAPWYHRIAAGAAGMASDLPLSIGAAVAAAPTGPVGMMAAAVAAPMALRDALVTAYNHDHALSWAGAWDIALSAAKGGAKGAVIGAATGGAGKLAAPLLAPAGKVATAAGVAGAELTALTATSAAVEQHMPTWQDFMDNAILLGGMKGAVGVAKGLRNVYAETGKKPEQVLADAAKDPAITLDLKPVEAPSTKEPMVTTHHGSPHVFDKFDASKINTGEGMQAYGHGIYLAENPKVAESYKANLEGATYAYVDGAAVKGKPTLSLAIEAIVKQPASPKAYIERFAANNPWLKITTQEAIDLLPDVAKMKNLSYGPKDGALYKVEVPQRVVDTMLDWDKPLSEQTAILTQLGITEKGLHQIKLIGGAGDSVESLLMALSATMAKSSGLNMSSNAAASAQLLKKGVRGVKYFDGFSREDGTGTRNYVLFDANDAHVVARNGQPIGATQQPSAYAPLALEQRIQAAIGADPRPDLVRRVVSGEREWLPPNEHPAVAWEYVTDGETARGVLRAVTERYGAEIEAQRRGVVTNADSLKDAQALLAKGKTGPHEIGAAGNSGEIMLRAALLRDALGHARDELAKIANVPELELSDAMKLQALAAIERVSVVNAEFAGVRAEAGRALEIFRAVKRGDPTLEGEASALLALVERKGKLQDIAALARSLNTPEQLHRFLADVNKATTTEKVLEAWKAAILSGPQTHLANILGNLGKWGVEIPESMIAASFTAAQRALARDPMKFEAWKARAFAPLYGLQFGAKDALHVAAEVWRGQGGAVEKGDVYRTAIEGKKGEIIRLPFKALQVEDVLFRTVTERAEAHIMATDRALTEGLNPRTAEFRERVAQLTSRPELDLSEKAGLEAIARVQQAGAEGVFAQRLGPRLETIQRAMAGHWSQFIIPFFRTPANLVSWAVQHTPGLNLMSGRWRADYAAGGERQARAVARITVGTGLAVTAYTLAGDGFLTGGGQFDKEQRGTKAAAGWQPYSVKIGDTYYSYQRMEPVGKILGIAADLVELQQASKDPQDKAKIASMLVLMFGNATVSTTYLSGLSNAIQSISDPTRYGENFLEQYASSLVPKIIGQPVAMADPYKREVDGSLDAIQSQIPFLREKLLPKRDVWGEPVKNERLFEAMPIAKSQQSHDKVKTEAVRLQLAITDAPKFLTEQGPFKPGEKRIELTGEQRDIFKQVSGHAAMEILAPIVNAPDWDRIPDFAKVAIYKDVIEGARKQGQYAALPPDAAAREQLRQKIVDKIIKQTQEAESADTRARFDSKGNRR